MGELLLRRIISGGQIGADEGGVRAGVALHLETGGHMPAGWRTLTGPRPDFAELYGMTACTSGGYPTRTRLNVRNADATVRFAYDFQSAGERLTLRFCRDLLRPYFDVPLARPGLRLGTWDGHTYIATAEPADLRAWLIKHQVAILNVAGNGNADITDVVERFLVAALTGDGGPSQPASALADVAAPTQQRLSI